MNRIFVTLILLVAVSENLYCQEHYTENTSIASNKKTQKSNTQHNETDASYEEAMKENDALKRKKANLRNKLKELSSQQATTQSDIERKKKELKRTENEYDGIRKEHEETGINGDEEIKKQLRDSIQNIDYEIRGILKEIEKLSIVLSNIENEEAKLNDIKGDISKRLLDENTAYLEQSFSSMQIEELKTAKEKCENYAADVSVASLVKRLKETIENKEVYDKAVSVLNSKYSESSINSSISALYKIKDNNEIQTNEIKDALKGLQNFKPGLEAFKDFINELNEKRSGITEYSATDLKEDMPYILNTNSLEKRIEKYLKLVPYLSSKFDEYMGIIKKTPSNHPQIEREILEQ